MLAVQLLQEQQQQLQPLTWTQTQPRLQPWSSLSSSTERNDDSKRQRFGGRVRRSQQASVRDRSPVCPSSPPCAHLFFPLGTSCLFVIEHSRCSCRQPIFFYSFWSTPPELFYWSILFFPRFPDRKGAPTPTTISSTTANSHNAPRLADTNDCEGSFVCLQTDRYSRGRNIYRAKARIQPKHVPRGGGP